MSRPLELRHPSPLHVAETGAGDPPVVLVHGFGANAHFWRKWLPALSLEQRVLNVELMGSGRAAAPPGGDYSLAQQAHHLVEFIRRLDGPPPVLVGHSLGGGLVLLAALALLDERSPSFPSGLVIVSGAAYPQRLPPYLTLARRRSLGWLLLLAAPPRSLLRRGLRGIVHDPDTVDDELVEGYREPLTSLRRRRALLRAARQLDPESAAAASRYGELDLPVLLLWGEEDRVVPLELGRRLESDLPNARLVTLPDVGHLPPEEDPEGSLQPVLTFVRGLRGYRGPTLSPR